MTLEACTQPGCTGQIEDGYCNVCGMPGRRQRGRRRRSVRRPSGKPQPARSPPSCRARRSVRRGRVSAARRAGWSARAPGSSTSAPASPPCRRRRCPTRSRSSSPTPRSPRTSGSARRAATPVGRSRGGRAGRTEGFCPKCRTAVLVHARSCSPATSSAASTRWSAASPTAASGWIYLARDRNVSDRYVVLKGLLNSGDADAFAAAIAEQQFLAEVQHPLILEIYNFASHEGAGYIVMEYVGGQSLKQILKDRMTGTTAVSTTRSRSTRRSRTSSRSSRRSRTCTRRDCSTATSSPTTSSRPATRSSSSTSAASGVPTTTTSAIYGTVGLPGPRGRRRRAERRRATSSPSAGRSRCWRWSSAATSRRTSRRCRRSTTPRCSSATTRSTACWPRPPRTNPDDRFQSADELRDQLLGVLREVVAVDSGSRGRGALHRVVAVRCADRRRRRRSTWAELPALRVDRADPMADLARRRLARRRRPAARGARTGARADGRGAAREGTRRRSTPASFPLADKVIDADPHRQPVGVAGGVAVGSRRARARPTTTPARDRVQHGAGPGAGRARAQARPRARLRAAPGDDDLAEQLYAVVRGHRRELRRPGRVRPRPDPRSAAATSPARSPRSTSSRRPAARTSAARRRRAELLTADRPRASTTLAAAAASIDGHRHRPAGPARPCRCRSSWPRSPTVERNGDQPRRTSAACRGDRAGRCGPRPSTRTASWRRSPPTAPNGRASSTPPTRSDRGRWCERARPSDSASTAGAATLRRAHGAGRPSPPPTSSARRAARRSPRPRRRRRPSRHGRAGTVPEPERARRRLDGCSCGGEIDADGWCTVCGLRAPQRARPLQRAAGARRRGGVRQGDRARPQRGRDRARPRPTRRIGVLVVCDGVTTATDSDVAVARRGRAAARDVLADRTTRRRRARRRRRSSTGPTPSRDAAAAAQAAAADCRDVAVGAGRRTRRRAPSSPPSSTVRSSWPPGWATAAATGCGDDGTAVAALDRRLVGQHPDRPGHRRATWPRPTPGARDHPLARRRRPGGAPSTASVASTGPGGCWSAATASGTTVRPPTTSARSSVTGWPTSGDDPLAVGVVAVRLGERTGRPRQHHRRPRAVRIDATRPLAPPDGPDQEHVMADWTAEVFENEYLAADAHRRPRDRDGHVQRRRARPGSRVRRPR